MTPSASTRHQLHASRNSGSAANPPSQIPNPDQDGYLNISMCRTYAFSDKNRCSPPVSRHAYLDLLGTLVQHKKSRPVPLMDAFLQAMSDHGWRITIFSSYLPAQARRLMDAAGISLNRETRILSSSGRDKGEALLADLNGQKADEIIFLDDKPQNLDSVKNACPNHVRVIGFVGSYKYVPTLSRWCASSGVELALSTVDLCEGLGIRMHSSLSDFKKFTESELFSLIPGLDHPMSAIAGETCNFDHRSIFALLFKDGKLKNFDDFWSNIAWITCNECLWKVLVESVLLAKSLHREDVLGIAYKDHEYTAELKSYAQRHPEVDLRSTFENATECIQKGIRKLGIEAENCRMSNRPMEKHRLQANERRIQECFG
jgi:hypothetical protein